MLSIRESKESRCFLFSSVRELIFLLKSDLANINSNSSSPSSPSEVGSSKSLMISRARRRSSSRFRLISAICFSSIPSWLPKGAAASLLSTSKEPKSLESFDKSSSVKKGGSSSPSAPSLPVPLDPEFLEARVSRTE